MIVNRSADGHTRIHPVDGHDACKYAALCGAVAVDERGTIGPGWHGQHLFAAQDEPAELLRSGHAVKLASDLGGHEGMGDAHAVEPLLHRRQIQAYLLLDDAHARAGGQRRVLIHHVGVKAKAGIGRHAAVFVQMEIIPVPMAEVGQVPVLQHHALGRPHGAGGVEQYEKILRRRMRARCGNGWESIYIPREQHGAVVFTHPVQQGLVRDQQPAARVPQHEGQPFGGTGGVQRLIGRSRLQHAEGGNDHPFTAGDEYGDHVALPDALPAQEAADALGDVVHPAVAQCPVLEYHGGVVRVSGCRRAEHGHNVGHGSVVDGVVPTVHHRQLIPGDRLDLGHVLLAQQLGQHLLHRAGHGLDERRGIVVASVHGLKEIAPALAPQIEAYLVIRIVRAQYARPALGAVKNHVAVVHVALIGKADRQGQAARRAHVQIGVETVRPRPGGLRVQIAQIVVHAAVRGDAAKERKGAYKHAAAVPVLRRAPRHGRAERGLSGAGEQRQGIAHRAGKDGAGADAAGRLLPLDRPGVHPVKPAGIMGKALGFAVRIRVGGLPLRVGEQCRKVSPVRREGPGLLQRLLPEGKFIRSEIGAADVIAAEGGFEIPNEILTPCAIHHNVVNDEIVFQRRGRFRDDHAIQPAARNVDPGAIVRVVAQRLALAARLILDEGIFAAVILVERTVFILTEAGAKDPVLCKQRLRRLLQPRFGPGLRGKLKAPAQYIGVFSFRVQRTGEIQ